MSIVIYPSRQVSPLTDSIVYKEDLYNWTRENFRDFAKLHGVKRGRNVYDTIENLLAAGKLEKRIVLMAR